MSVELESAKRLKQLVQSAQEKTGVTASNITDCMQVLVKATNEIDDLLSGSATSLYNDRVTEIAPLAFYMNQNIQSVNFPNVTVLGPGAFADSKLVSAELPSLISTDVNYDIGGLSSFYATYLVSVYFPLFTGYTDMLFYACFNLQEARLPSVSIVGDSMFGGCYSLTTVELGDVQSVGYGAFANCESIRELRFPNIKRVEPMAFSNCYAAEVLEIPRDVEYVGGRSFENCKGLLDANFTEITTVETSAFAGSGVVTATLPKVLTIKSTGFKRCESLKYVDLPVATSIEANAFNSCSSLETLIIRTPTVCKLGSTNAFSDSAIQNKTGYVYVPSDLVSQYQSATNWTTYKTQIRAIEDYPDITGGAA